VVVTRRRKLELVLLPIQLLDLWRMKKLTNHEARRAHHRRG
jgi:hypothetical protein